MLHPVSSHGNGISGDYPSYYYGLDNRRFLFIAALLYQKESRFFVGL
jgi:hypothetical protein